MIDPASTQLWALETRFLDPAEIDRGIIPPALLNSVSLLLVALFWAAPSYLAYTGQLALPPALFLLVCGAVLGRMVAVDLAHLLLLNVYTLPLTAGGIIFQLMLGHQPWWHSLAGLAGGVLLGLGLDFAVRLFRQQDAGELGFGDVKLLAAVGAWVGLLNLPFALVVACVVNLILSFTVAAAPSPAPPGPAPRGSRGPRDDGPRRHSRRRARESTPDPCRWCRH